MTTGVVTVQERREQVLSVVRSPQARSTVFGLILSLLSFGCGPEPLRRGACDLVGSGIINGEPCDLLLGPVVPVTAVFDVRGRELRQGCSGTIISDRFVLTAAHCFEPPASTTAKRVEVVVGGRTLSTTWFAAHPEATWRPAPELSPGQVVGFHDIGLVRLEESSPVAPLPLRFQNGLGAGDVVTVAGFGVDENEQTGVLRAGQLRLARVSAGHLVAAVDPTGAAACFGDSGGPAVAVIDGVPSVVGVVSSAIALDEAADVLICSDVSTVLVNLDSPGLQRFIEGVLAKNSP